MCKTNLLRCMLSLLLGLVCNVVWAQDYAISKETSAPSDGYYAIYSESSSGSGWVHYNSTLDRKFRVATDVDLTNGIGADQSMYIWKLVNGENNTFTLQCMYQDIYMPADESRNKNMQGTTPANLTLTAVDGAEGTWFISQTNYTNGGNPLYIHTNTPGGYPNLSYWDDKSVNGTSVRVQFYKVEEVDVEEKIYVYTPTRRATTLEAGKKYMIYNTCFNDNEDRTGFLFDNGSGLGHTGAPKVKPSALKTTLDAYLWEVETTDEAGKFYLKAADGGYVNATGKTDNPTAQVLYIQNWNTSTATKAGVKSEGEDGTVVENANIGGDVFTISGTKVGNTGQDCWNGNPNTFAKWESAHPFAFYEVEKVEVGDAFPKPGKTYYIYCDNDTRQYFYNDGGTLKVSEKRTEWSNEYLFTCTFDGQYFQFKNMKGKYLAHKGLSDNAHNFELSAYLDGVNLKTPNGSYFVMKADGGFDQSSIGTYDPASTNFSTVYKFEEYNFPVDGETYYIYSDTYYNNEYVNGYMYADGGSLKLNTSLAITDAYKWTCKVTADGKVQFQNGAGKYLAHKGIQDAAYNFTLNKSNATHAIAATLYSDAASRYFVVKNDGSAFDQSTGTYNQTSGDWCTDFVFMPVNDVKVLVVNTSSQSDAQATWNGETKSLPASWVITSQTVVTDATLSVTSTGNFTFSGLYNGDTSLGMTTEIESLDDNLTLTAKFVPAFFSQNVGDKWINIVRKTDAGHAMFLGSNVADAKPTFNKKDYTNTGMLWSFVGTADNFKIYNYVSGEALALTPSAASIGDIGDGTEVKMVAAADAQSWHLIEKDGGYAIAPVGNNDWSLNSYGGTDYLGANIKFYGANDGGSHWNFDLIDVENTLSMGVYVDQVLESSPRVAELTLSIDGSTAQTRIEGNVETTATYYLPKGATLSLSSMTYRGYELWGIWGVDNPENFTIPVGGVELSAYYNATEERTLYYTPRENHPYRIPAIATAPNGDIFAICDYRPCGGDIGNGDVDIVCRISTDNGVNWGAEFTVADGKGGNTNVMETGYGDPAIVADRDQNKLLVMMVSGRTTCWNGRWDKSKIGVKDATAVNRVARVYANYNEETKTWDWTQPEEVTDSIYSIFLNGETPTVTSMFIGSGKICQSRVVKKNEYYRLYCALWTRDEGNRVIYSDDFGMSWNVLGTISDRPASGGDEPKVEELADGTVVLSSRVSGGRWFNIFTFNNEGKSDAEKYTTGSWGSAVKSTSAYDGSGNGTNGEIYKVKAVRKSDGEVCDVMLQSIPAGPNRSNVKVYYKEMNYSTPYTPAAFAEGWQVGKHVSTKESAYSTMIMQADGRIGFFFEEEPGGYCMVYIPYCIEDLTNGQYEACAENEAPFLMHAAPKVLALTGVGYPEEDSEVRNDLTKAIETVNAGNASTEDYEALSNAYEAYITTTDVQMPADGGTYIIYSVLTTDENNFSPSFNVLKYDEQSGVLTVAQKSATDDDAEKFVCRVIDAENKLYAFVNAKNGKYTIYYSPKHLASDNGQPIVADNGKATGFSQSYNCMGKDEADLYLRSTADLRLGTFAISGKDANTWVHDYWSTLFVDDDQLDRHSGRSDISNVNLICEANASSVFAFQEVSYPNNVKLNTIKDTDVCLHNIGVGKGIGTFSAPFATLVPEGVTAYYAASKTANGATLAVMEGQAIPAHQGVILVGESGIASSLMVPAKTNGSEIEADATIEGNLFCHTAGTTHVLELGDYVLGNRVNINGEYFTKGIAFYQGTVGTVAGKNKAYIVLGADSQVKAYALDFGGEVTHITGVENNASDAGLPVYDLSGRRVSQLNKGGVYIRGGKKFIVK